LDIPSKDVLKKAIKAFDGTAIIVSHDREFLDGLVDKVYEFGEGVVREHLGGIYDFLRNKQSETIAEAIGEGDHKSKDNAPQETAKAEEPKTSSDDSQMSYAERKEIQKKVRKIEKQVAESEKKIAEMEERLKELDAKLSKPENATDMKLVAEYTDTTKALEAENEKWLELSEQLEEIRID
jgi:ATP-binding cassette subfamily F protein 3